MMALASPAALALLILIADSPREYVGGVIFGVSMLLLFSASSAYHLIERGRSLLQRIDHSMIFVLIAGTYTPFCLVLLGNGWGIPSLSLMWGLAAAGVALKAVKPTPPRWVNLALYMGMGWIGMIAIVPFTAAAPASVLALMLAGGFLYTVGGVIHALRRPDPFPRVFGYHELFHLLSAIAGLTFYSTVVYTFG